MKSFIIIVVAVAFINGAIPNHSALAEAEKYLGPPEMCLYSTRIKETVTLDDQTILFKMLGGGIFINRLTYRCAGLKVSNGFSYSTSITKICKQDIISLLLPGSVSGGKCSLGDFLPFRYEGKSGEAIKRLEDGLLDELVTAGAFEKPFSGNK